jgi:hypothetical protein
MATRLIKTREIAVIDEAGNLLVIDEITQQNSFDPMSGPREWTDGARRYELDGEHCNQIDNDTWKTLNTSKLLMRVKP